MTGTDGGAERGGEAVLALDAGGSRCRALLVAADGAVLAAATAAAAPAALPEATLTAALRGLFARLLAPSETGPPAASGGPPGVAVLAGFAGAGRPAGAERARRALDAALRAAGLCPRALALVTDAELALAAVAPGSAVPVAVLIAGTGSIALAGTPGGPVARAGGWGRWLGDEGGGFWLGWRALCAVGRGADGRSRGGGPLAAAVLAALGLGDADALVEAAPGLWGEAGRVAALAPLVLRLAGEGEPVAAGLVAEGGRVLAELLVAARRRAALPPEAPTGLAGGLWREGSALRAALLGSLPPGVGGGCHPLAVPAVVGGACTLLPPAAAARLVRSAVAGPWAAALQ